MLILKVTADHRLTSPFISDGTAKVSKSKAEAVPAADPRREQLLKWREQQMLKKKMQAAQKAKRKSFVIRQIKHAQTPFFTMDKSAKVTKKPVLVKPAEFQQKPPEKRVTRASARLAATTATAQDKGIKTISKANTRSGSADQSNAINKTTKAKAGFYPNDFRETVGSSLLYGPIRSFTLD